MKRALKNLLAKLEAIEEDYSGLGDTGVREQMREHVHRAFLDPEPGFEPSGEYGLSPKANRRVAAALTSFCRDATKAAKRDGLLTVEQRLAAFQDPKSPAPAVPHPKTTSAWSTRR